jgi:hypothetical protein
MERRFVAFDHHYFYSDPLANTPVGQHLSTATQTHSTGRRTFPMMDCFGSKSKRHHSSHSGSRSGHRSSRSGGESNRRRTLHDRSSYHTHPRQSRSTRKGDGVSNEDCRSRNRHSSPPGEEDNPDGYSDSDQTEQYYSRHQRGRRAHPRSRQDPASGAARDTGHSLNPPETGAATNLERRGPSHQRSSFDTRQPPTRRHTIPTASPTEPGASRRHHDQTFHPSRRSTDPPPVTLSGPSRARLPPGLRAYATRSNAAVPSTALPIGRAKPRQEHTRLTSSGQPIHGTRTGISRRPVLVPPVPNVAVATKAATLEDTTTSKPILYGDGQDRVPLAYWEDVLTFEQRELAGKVEKFDFWATYDRTRYPFLASEYGTHTLMSLMRFRHSSLSQPSSAKGSGQTLLRISARYEPAVFGRYSCQHRRV